MRLQQAEDHVPLRVTYVFLEHRGSPLARLSVFCSRMASKNKEERGGKKLEINYTER